MTERPILFSAPMVRAILDDRKCATRRLLKLKGYKTFSEFGPSTTRGYDWHFRRADKCWCDFTNADLLKLLPFKVGDRLWVREAHYLTDDGDYEFAVYAADELSVKDHLSKINNLGKDFPEEVRKEHLKLRPSIFMPRWASRITLEVTGVKVERLQDISEADVVAEGIVAVDNGFHWLPDNPNAKWATLRYKCAVYAFQGLWESINGTGSWERNPWVIAISFRRV